MFSFICKATQLSSPSFFAAHFIHPFIHLTLHSCKHVQSMTMCQALKSGYLKVNDVLSLHRELRVQSERRHLRADTYSRTYRLNSGEVLGTIRARRGLNVCFSLPRTCSPGSVPDCSLLYLQPQVFSQNLRLIFTIPMIINCLYFTHWHVCLLSCPSHSLGAKNPGDRMQPFFSPLSLWI